MEKIKYIRLVLPIRYENDDLPEDFPWRVGNTLDITYDVKTGDIIDFDNIDVSINYIINWNEKQGERVCRKLLDDCIFELNDLKVVDEGCYYLLDENMNILYSLEGEYVPDSYSVDGEYGDYINLHIDLKNGKVLNVRKDATFKEFLRNE